MGNDDLHSKKRERTNKEFKRKKQTLVRQPKILIVCEYSKSSAFYLEELAKDLGLTAVKIEGKRCGSAPSSVLGFAKDQYAKSKQDGDAYNRVYCVFDRDQHDSFDATVEAIEEIKPENVFFAITTTPCFEFWLLLHFAYSAKAYAPTTQESPCDCANVDLQTHWQKAFGIEYGKNKRSIYASSKGKIQDAISNARKLTAENLTTGSSNPQTNMHGLIEYLQSIRR